MDFLSSVLEPKVFTTYRRRRLNAIPQNYGNLAASITFAFYSHIKEHQWLSHFILPLPISRL
ncbi:MAG: hypothetical protein IPM69_16420 [Ignavibacteria bacterium]|nr:hypothetical protein [Ignavibacteria bacterium]